MRKCILIFITITICSFAPVLSQQIYDCNNQTGTSIETRLCLRMEFEKLDSILTENLHQFLSSIEDSLLIENLKNFHSKWIENRHLLSLNNSEGLSGNSKAIYYLSSMIYITKAKNEEILFLISSQ